MKPRRSVLYLPASNARAIEKARTLPCDAVVLDLEDAVGPGDKAAARAAAQAAVRAGGFGRREVVVRVNGLDTPWGLDDLAAIAAAGPDAILAPKVSALADVAAYRERAGATPLWLMVETCAAVFALDALAGAPGVEALVFGANDLAKEMGARISAGRAPLQAAMALTVAAARAHGRAALDSVFNDFRDAAGLAAECAQGRDFGFDGKTLIHPAQIAAANAAFSPDEAEIAWAQAVAKAFDSPENAGKGVISVEGRMVERLHRDAALRVLALSDARTKDG